MAEFLIGLAIGFLMGSFVQVHIDKVAFHKVMNELDAIERKVRNGR